MKIRFEPRLAKSGWRVVMFGNDTDINLCGAETENVAWRQCEILNQRESILTTAVPTVKVVR